MKKIIKINKDSFVMPTEKHPEECPICNGTEFSDVILKFPDALADGWICTDCSSLYGLHTGTGKVKGE